MNPALLASLINVVGTTGLPLIAQLMTDIKTGKSATTVTPEDLMELHRLSTLTSADILAKQGIVLPPVAPPTQV